MAIRLGDKVSDVLTGIKGVAWSRISYLTSPDQIGVLTKAEDNKPADVIYIDEDRLLARSISELQVIKYGGSE
jgi:hypothetical protein